MLEPSDDLLLVVRLLAVVELVLMGVLVALIVPAVLPAEVDRSPGSAADEASRLAVVVAAGPGDPRDPEVLAAALDRLTAQRVDERCAAADADRFCFVLDPDAYRARFDPTPDYARTGRVDVAPDRPSRPGQDVCLTIPADRSDRADVVAGACPG